MSLKYFWNLKYDLNFWWACCLQKAVLHKYLRIFRAVTYHSAFNVNRHLSSCLWISKHKPIDKLIEWWSSLEGPGTTWVQHLKCRLLRNQAFHSNDDVLWAIQIFLRKRNQFFYDPLENAKKLLISWWSLLFFWLF